MSSPRMDSERSKPVLMPSMAVPMSVTATMPMMTPSAVKKERVRFARICASAILQDSKNSKARRFIPGAMQRKTGFSGSQA